MPIKRLLRTSTALLLTTTTATFALQAQAHAATSVSYTTPLEVTNLGTEVLARGSLPEELVVGDCHARAGSNVAIHRLTNGMAYVDWNQLAFSTDTNDTWTLSLRFKDPNGLTWVTANLPAGTKMVQRNKLYLWNKENPLFPLSAQVMSQITAPGSTVEWLNAC